MGKLLLREKGSIYIITLNVIIILSIFLFSFSFNSAVRLRMVNGESKRYQAYLNAKSGIIMAMKELREGKLSVPGKKEYALFDDEQYKADVSLVYAAINKKDEEIRIQPAPSGGVVNITSVGKYKDVDWTIIKVMEGGRELFYYSR
jgi:hypothetical protein